MLEISDNKLENKYSRKSESSDWVELKALWRADLYRYAGKTSRRLYLYKLMRSLSYRYLFIMRLCTFLAEDKRNGFRTILFRLFYEILRHYSIMLGISIPCYARIGGGLFIPHPINITINEEAVIGNNCNISQGVTIGQLNRGERKGCPVIGDNVFIGPGAVILGKIKIGNNAAIGANSVVTRDVPDNAVVVGVPARIISYKGSAGYINNTEYNIIEQVLSHFRTNLPNS